MQLRGFKCKHETSTTLKCEQGQIINTEVSRDNIYLTCILCCYLEGSVEEVLSNHQQVKVFVRYDRGIPKGFPFHQSNFAKCLPRACPIRYAVLEILFISFTNILLPHQSYRS